MLNWSIYDSLLTTYGTSERERVIQEAKEDFALLSCDSAAYKSVLIKNHPCGALIYSGSNEFTKTFSTTFEDVDIGDYILINDNHWIVTEIDDMNEITRDGKIRKCNQLFRFQTFDSQIHEVWGVIDDPYWRSPRTEIVVNTAYSLVQAILPNNEYTKQLHIDQKIILWTGYNALGEVIPFVFRISDFKKASTDYGGDKIISYILERVQSTSEDSIEHMVSDYKIPSDIKDSQFCKITGGSIIRNGDITGRTLYAEFLDQDSNLIDIPIHVEWSIPVIEHIKYKIVDDRTVTFLSDGSDSAIGLTFQVGLHADGFISDEKTMEVV